MRYSTFDRVARARRVLAARRDHDVRCRSRQLDGGSSLADRSRQDALRARPRDRPERQISDFKLTADEVDDRRGGPPRRRARQRAQGRARRLRPADPALAEERMSAGPMSRESRRRTRGLRSRRRCPGAERSATGVVVIPITEGTGANPTAASTVRVHYHGTLRDGTVFDSSVRARRADLVPAERRHSVLDRRRAEDQGRRQSEARVPGGHGLRRSRLGLDPGRRRARVRGRAARDRVTRAATGAPPGSRGACP